MNKTKSKYHKFASPEHYDKLALNNPIRWISPLDELVDNIIRVVIVSMYPESRDGLKVLDMGCGGGRTIRVLSNMGLDIIGIDFSDETLKIARNVVPDATLINMDVINTSFLNKSFDIVLSVGTHEHLRKIDFSEPRRLVKDKGVFICVLPATEDSRGWTAKLEGLWEWHLPRDEWCAELEKYNFRIDLNILHPWLFVCHPI